MKAEPSWFIPRKLKENLHGTFNNILQKMVDGRFHECRIEDLSPYHVYRFRIAAKNSKYMGRFSNWVLIELGGLLMRFFKLKHR